MSYHQCVLGIKNLCLRHLCNREKCGHCININSLVSFLAGYMIWGFTWSGGNLRFAVSIESDDMWCTVCASDPPTKGPIHGGDTVDWVKTGTESNLSCTWFGVNVMYSLYCGMDVTCRWCPFDVERTDQWLSLLHKIYKQRETTTVIRKRLKERIGEKQRNNLCVCVCVSIKVSAVSSRPESSW